MWNLSAFYCLGFRVSRLLGFRKETSFLFVRLPDDIMLWMTFYSPHRFAPDCRFGRGSCCGARQPRGVAWDEWPLRSTLESAEQY